MLVLVDVVLGVALTLALLLLLVVLAVLPPAPFTTLWLLFTMDNIVSDAMVLVLLFSKVDGWEEVEARGGTATPGFEVTLQLEEGRKDRRAREYDPVSP